MNDAAKPEAAQLPAVAVPKRETIIVASEVPVLDTGLFEQMQRIAKIMAASNLVPEHLNRVQRSGQQEVRLTAEEALANCFLVVNQSVRWRMDPFAVAQGVFVLRGKVGYEGKLIAAVINSHPALEQRLSYRYEGAGVDKKIIVSGKVRGDSAPREIEGTVKQWATSNDSWQKIPDQMLAYRGAREWARRWMPEAILGVYADEEVEAIARDITPAPEVEGGMRGAGDRLKAALGASMKAEGQRIEPGEKIVVDTAPTAEPQAATARADAVVVDEGDAALAKVAEKKEPEKFAEPEKKALPRGTPKIRKSFLDVLGAAKDRNELAAVYEDTNLYEWEKADREMLAKEYAIRQHKLKA